jgi:NAD(P)-dependent dehydrogenase (short-subunit alcohol dehydrogenase family)
MRLAGKVAFITGAGGGVGSATARRMAREGAQVALAGRGAPSLRAVAQEIEAAGGVALPVVCDVSSSAQVDRAVRATVERFGRVDIVVANAAIQLHDTDRPLPDLDDDTWEHTQATNLRGTFLTCRAGIRQFLAQGQGGAVIVVSSVTALVGIAARNPAYSASKGGQLALARALAVQHAPDGIRVNVVCPGALEAPPDVERLGPDGPAARMQRMLPQIPLGRLGRFEEIAPLITFLASDDASYITGATFTVDGGLTAR